MLRRSFLQHAEPGARLGYDCGLISAGLRKGKRWSCSARRPFADLWRAFWQALEEHGGSEAGQAQGVQLVNVKAHTAAADIARGVISYADRRGNFAGDLAAKQALHHHNLPQEALEDFEELGETIPEMGR